VTGSPKEKSSEKRWDERGRRSYFDWEL